MTGYWAEDLDISDPEVLAAEGERVGLDPDDVRDAAVKHPYNNLIQASTAAVQELGAGGVPAFVIADRVLIPGAQPHELFEKVMQKLEFESVESTDDSPTATS
jgi:predicted DsbA family dithiol-disulfide isomerase